jgi:hypothetical protein
MKFYPAEFSPSFHPYYTLQNYNQLQESYREQDVFQQNHKQNGCQVENKD